MAFQVHLTSKASPQQVLDAIEENAREWRESVIPRPVRVGGVLQVVAEIQPPAFALRYERRDKRRVLQLRGTVRAAPDGLTKIEATCGTRGAGVFGAPILVILAVKRLILGPSDGMHWGLWLLIAAGWIAIDALNNRSVRPLDDEAAYLVRRLEEAVAAADARLASTAAKRITD